MKVMTTRLSSFPAWIYPWLEWSFYDNDDKESIRFGSNCHLQSRESCQRAKEKFTLSINLWIYVLCLNNNCSYPSRGSIYRHKNLKMPTWHVHFDRIQSVRHVQTRLYLGWIPRDFKTFSVNPQMSFWRENHKNDYKGKFLDLDDFTLCMIFVFSSKWPFGWNHQNRQILRILWFSLKNWN